jgi:VanZ family protein
MSDGWPGIRGYTGGLAKSAKVAERGPMRADLLGISLRFLTWSCAVLLAFLSLLPTQEMVRTELPGQLEHFVAYAGSTAIAMAAYRLRWGCFRIVGCFWVYAGVLEYLQHFSPGRHPALEDFAVSALGALCGGAAALLLRRSRWFARPRVGRPSGALPLARVSRPR